MIYVGNDKIKEIYVGSDKIKAVYHGSDLVYSSAVQDGYWVHKDTDAVTYFGSGADFINNGVMSRPSWIENAKEIRLCTGITEFKTQLLPEFGISSGDVFGFVSALPILGLDVDILNPILEKLDFGNSSVSVIPTYTVDSIGVDAQTPVALQEIILNDKVSIIDNSAIIGGTFVIEMYPGIERIGMLDDDESYYYGGIQSYGGLLTIKTPQSNVSALTSYLADREGAGSGGKINGNYEIIAL